MAKCIMDCPNCGRYVEAKTGFFTRKKIDCVCGYTINVKTEKLAARTCPHCGNEVVFDQSKGEKALCLVCDFVNDVPERLMAEKIRKEGLASIIKYEGDNETLVWKHPIEDFNLGSQLIIHES